MTTVDLDEPTWKRLNALKKPGDSFDDVVRHLLNECDDTGETAHATND